MRDVTKSACLASISGKLWDVVVVGAGPAGSVAAALLAQHHPRVLLIEKSSWPREKACGGCVNAAAIALLHELRMETVLTSAPPLTQFSLHMGKRHLSLAMPAGAAVARLTFDDHLVQIAQMRGAKFLCETSAQLLPADPADSFRRLRILQHGESMEIRGRVIIACDGLRGTLLRDEPWAGWIAAPRSHIGISTQIPICDELPEKTIGMFTGTDGYVGLVRHADGPIHVGAALDPAACHAARGPLALIRHTLESSGIELSPNFEQSAFSGTGPLTAHRKSVAGCRVLAVGDSCGYVEPFTGEGIAWAIRGAKTVASLLPGDLSSWPTELESRWRALHQQEIGHRQRWCRRLRETLRRPTLASACFHAARAFPWAPTMVARRISA